MQVKTQAIVIHSVRYAEADLIVKMYSKEHGVISYILKGVLKSKKGKLRSSFFQLGNVLQIDALHKNKNGLQIIKEAKPEMHFKTVHSNVSKSSVLTFLFEIVNQIIVIEEPDEDFYLFLYNALLWLDQNNEISFFHTLFLIKMTSFLGCYPDASNSSASEFDIENGCFIMYSKGNENIVGEALTYFKILLGMKFDDLKINSMPKTYRKELLNSILKYYNFHVPGYREPKSLLILEQLFY